MCGLFALVDPKLMKLFSNIYDKNTPPKQPDEVPEQPDVNDVSDCA